MKRIKWEEIPGFSNYSISNYGDIVRKTPGKSTRVGKKLSKAVTPAGYIYVCLLTNGKQNVFLVHRLVALTFIGPPPSLKHQIAHYDGNKKNNYVGNLRWATPVENQEDKVRHGTSNRGSRHSFSKLTEAQVLKIRALRKERGLFNKVIAARFGVTPMTVWDIVTRRTWKHI